MKNLERELKLVWNAPSWMEKYDAMSKLINESHAKKDTKEKALRDISQMTARQIDTFAANYMMSGEGLKVK